MLDLCIEIIEKCPNECLFCSSNSCINKTHIISLDEYKRIIDYFISNGGIKELSLSGGEPLLHPNIYEMIKYSKDKGIKTILFTSGIKLHNQLPKEQIDYYINEMNMRISEVTKYEEDNEFLINKIKKYYIQLLTPYKYSCITREEINKLELLGLDKIVFDFQGYEYQTDNYLMGRKPKMHELLLDSLIHTSNSCIDVDVHFVPMKPNYKEITDIVELLSIGHIENISILRFVPQGRGRINKEELELNNEEEKEFINLLNEASKKYNGKIRMGIHMQKDNTHKCNAGLTKLDIKYDGTIIPCPAIKELTKEEALKYGIHLYTIDEIEKVKIIDSTRVIPLCQKVYKRNKTS